MAFEFDLVTTISGIIAVLATTSFLSMHVIGVEEFEEAGIDVDGNAGDDGPSVISYKNFVIFMAVSAWTTFIGEYLKADIVQTIIISLVLGIGAVVINYAALRFLLKMQQDNSYSLQSLVNKEAKVIVSIPPAGHGAGKIQLIVHGTLRTFSAESADRMYLTGETVYIESGTWDNELPFCFFVTNYETPPIKPEETSILAVS